MQAFQVADGGGLFIDVLPGGKRVWRLRYRLAGKQEKVTLGEYPAYSLAGARKWREECRAMVAHGRSPMRAKQTAKAAQSALLTDTVTVEAFAYCWLAEVVQKTTQEPKNVRRVVEKDIIPAIGKKLLAQVTVSDVLVISELNPFIDSHDGMETLANVSQWLGGLGEIFVCCENSAVGPPDFGKLFHVISAVKAALDYECESAQARRSCSVKGPLD